MKKKTYRVVLTYFHEFTVEASSPSDAIRVAHSSGNGSIIDCDDSDADVEEIEEEE